MIDQAVAIISQLTEVAALSDANGAVLTPPITSFITELGSKLAQKGRALSSFQQRVSLISDFLSSSFRPYSSLDHSIGKTTLDFPSLPPSLPFLLTSVYSSSLFAYLEPPDYRRASPLVSL